MDIAIVFDESQFSEFIHEEIDSGPRRANHLRQHFLRNLGENFLRMVWRAVARKEQQGARQPLFAGVKKLVDKGLLSSCVS